MCQNLHCVCVGGWGAGSCYCLGHTQLVIPRCAQSLLLTVLKDYPWQCLEDYLCGARNQIEVRYMRGKCLCPVPPLWPTTQLFFCCQTFGLFAYLDQSLFTQT